MTNSDSGNKNRYIWLGPFIRTNSNYKFKEEANGVEVIIDIIAIFLPWLWNMVALGLTIFASGHLLRAITQAT